MNISRYNSWRFIHPDFDSPASQGEGVLAGGVGLQLSTTGGIAMSSDAAAVRQSILLLLSTSPGERVMRPLYGCDLRRLVFSPNDDSTAGLAIHYVRRAIDQWEARVQILDLDASVNPNDSAILDIYLRYRVKWNQQVDELSFGLHLSGGE